MSLKVSVSLSRPSPGPGCPNVTVTLEADLEPGALDDLARLRESLRGPLAAIQEVLAEGVPAEREASGSPSSRPSPPTSKGAGRGRTRPATQAQVRAIAAMIRRQKLRPGEWLREQVGVERPEDLTVQQASEVIDELKASAHSPAK